MSLETGPQKRFGPFLFDGRERLLERDGEPVPLTPKGFDLLEAFVDQPGRLLTKDELLKRVWPDTYVEEANLSYHVFGLRKALGEGSGNGHYIETVPKRGYRFTATVTPVINGTAAAPATPMLPDTQPAPRSGSSPRLSWRWVVGGVVVLAIVTGYLARDAWRTMGSGHTPRALPVIALSGVIRGPSLSPDAKYVVFSWTGEKTDNTDLYVQQIGAGVPLRLTTTPGNEYSPSWSPDGRTIAFLRRTPTEGSSEVWLIAPLGGPERKVADIQPRMPMYVPLSIAWCPDSRGLLVTDSAGPGHPDAIFRISIDSGDKRQLTHPKVLDTDPAVSPDGRSLVFRRNNTPFSGPFFRLPLNEAMMPQGEPIRLTEPLTAGKPSWTPDGREILFGFRGGLSRLDVSGGGTPARLAFVGQDGHSPTVARTADGRQRLVYVRSFADSNIWRVDTAGPGRPATSPAVSAIVSTRTDVIPNLSPDGRRIAFLSDRSGDGQIWMSDTDGSNAAQLTSMTFGSFPGFPRWSPDGHAVAFHGDPAGRPDVVVVPTRGGEPRILTAGLANGGFPSFSRDGRWIYFTYVQNGQGRIWKVPAAGGDAVQVTPNAGTLAIESPDGRELYYVDGAEGVHSIWRLPLTGGEPAKIVDGVMLGAFDVIEQGIYYIESVSSLPGRFSMDRPGRTRLQFHDFSTGVTTTVADDLGRVGFGLSASHDGRTVFFTRVDSSIHELTMVDDFR